MHFGLNTNALDHLIRISMEGPKVNRMGSISSTSAVGILGKQEAGDIRQIILGIVTDTSLNVTIIHNLLQLNM